MKKFALLASVFISGSAIAQTYSPMTWGIDKSTNPYAFGTNINGNWSKLGAISSTGQWSITNYLGIGPISDFRLLLGGAPDSTGYGGGSGSWIGPIGNAAWNTIINKTLLNPTEFQIYGNTAAGNATAVVGTGNLVLNSGSFAADSSWIDVPYFYFNNNIYLVSAVADSTHITVKNTNGSAVTFLTPVNDTFHVASTTAKATVNVSGSSVTRVSGEYFTASSNTSYAIINGTKYTVLSSTQNSLNLSSSAGTQSNVIATQYYNIFDEVATLRIQKEWGSNEENFSIQARATGDYQVRTQQAGSGKYWPIYIGTGVSPTNLLNQIVLYPAANGGVGMGDISLGNGYGADILRIPTTDPGGSPTNFIYLPASYVGNDIEIKALSNGVDPDIDISMVPSGSGNLKVNSDVVAVLSKSQTFTQPQKLATGSGTNGDGSYYAYYPSNTAINNYRWRTGTTLNGASNGYWYVQNSTSPDFTTGTFVAMACTTVGCGFGENVNPQYPLDVTGTARSTNIIVSSLGLGYVCSSGSGAFSSGATCATSDARLKIVDGNINNALEKISKLNGVMFHWNDKAKAEKRLDSNNHIGLLAQEVEKVFPESVSEVDGYKAVDYQSIVAPLIQAVKELKIQNEKLSSEIDKIKSSSSR